jgi:hypothetical protein
MVSVALVEAMNTPRCGVTVDHQSEPLYPAVNLWKPCAPSRGVTLLNSLIPEYQAHRCMMNMSFGGPIGEDLQYLTRMVFHIHSCERFIAGLSFEYLNAPPLHYGTRGNFEVSFLIRGPEGERIVEVVVEQEQHCAIASLQVSLEYFYLPPAVTTSNILETPSSLQTLGDGRYSQQMKSSTR